MKRFTQQFNNESKKISLTPREQEELLRRIETYIEYHPMVNTDRVNTTPKQTSLLSKYKYSYKISFGKSIIGKTSAAFALFMLVTIPVMAEQSMPGTVLHPVKVNVSEEIRGYFLSGEERVRWETERIERRLEEARKLALLGKLTPEIEARVVDSVAKQKSVTNKQIAFLQTKDEEAAVMATIALGSVLEFQETLLESVKQSESKNDFIELSKLIEVGKEESKNKVASSLLSEERLLAKIELHSNRAYELLISIEKLYGLAEKENIARRLQAIENDLAEYTINKVDAAFSEPQSSQLRDILSDLQKVISYTQSLREQNNVPLEQVIPLRLTTEERIKKIQDEREELMKRFANLQRLYTTITDESIMSEYIGNYEQLQRRIEQIAEVDNENIRATEERILKVRSQIALIEATIPSHLILNENTELENNIQVE
jgi:hypothetical protein